MRKTLVTGANGLLGRTLCNKLSQKCVVYAIVRSKPKDPVDSINYISLDLSREFSFDELPSEIDCVLHLAQSNKYKDFPEGASDVFSINVNLEGKLTTLLFFLTTYGFGIYIENFSNYNQLYGSIGALLIFLLYIWINSNILLLGFELNATLTRFKREPKETSHE